MRCKKMAKKTPEQEIKELKKELAQKNEYIAYLEKTEEAYEHMKELSELELKDADKRIRAQEIVQELMSQERKEADQIIMAHEQLEAYSLSEKRDAAQTIKAHETIQELSLMEKQEAFSQLYALKNVSQLSEEELKQKDEALLNILEVNQFISSLLDEDTLLKNIVEHLVDAVKADRALLMLQVGDFLLSKSFVNISGDMLSKKEFTYPLSVIEECKDTTRTQVVSLEPISGLKESKHISIMVMPLLYKNEWKGVLYVDKLSDTDPFHRQDQFIAEIYSYQVAISLHNAALYKRIIEQNGELLRLVNLRSQFITHISRYLKQPAERLARLMEKFQNLEKLSEEENGHITTASRTVANLITAADKMLTFEELSREVEDLFSENVDFYHVINILMGKYKDVIKEKDINLKINLIDDFRKYRSNEVIIRTILDEVIGNAIMYNKQSGWVEVNGRQSGEYLELTVKDNGNGIKKEDIKKIFEQFYRTEDSPILNSRGAGLGLFMVRNFLSYYGGEIKVKSEYGRGSTFTLTFLIHE